MGDFPLFAIWGSNSDLTKILAAIPGSQVDLGKVELCHIVISAYRKNFAVGVILIVLSSVPAYSGPL